MRILLAILAVHLMAMGIPGKLKPVLGMNRVQGEHPNHMAGQRCQDPFTQFGYPAAGNLCQIG
jgi:hypothetical protein